MAIGTPVQLGATTAGAGSTTLVLTTSADAPVGSLIVVLAAMSNNGSLTSVVDSAGNSYVAGALINNTVGKMKPFWAFSTVDLAAGGTVTATYAGTTGVKLIAAVAVAGIAARDAQAAGASGSGTTPSIASGVLGWPNEIVFGICDISGAASDTFTEASGFTANIAALNTDALRWAYQIVSASASVTYAPTLGTSRNWGVNTLTFSGALASPFNRTSRFTYLEM